jgi:hypothetical protein
MSEEQLIALEIRKQLFMHGAPIVWSWGARDWQALVAYENFRGGLRFRVSGALFKGIVEVRLTGADLYDVHLIRGKSCKQIADGIYFDQLTEVIDHAVETKTSVIA